jgi:hypothetical protein
MMTPRYSFSSGWKGENLARSEQTRRKKKREKEMAAPGFAPESQESLPAYS